VPVLRSPLLALPVAAAVSVLVELTQYAYVAGRATDVNDVLLNTAGALAGVVAFRAVRAVTDRALAHA
jgi:glycopeptide antibiotics resistance protein